MSLNTLEDLFLDELKDVYDAEQRILTALPKMEEGAKAARLKTAFRQHHKQTEGQVERLEKVFEILGKKPARKECKAMVGLLKEGDELLKEEADAEVLDAALIAAAQKVEHYEIATYGTLRTWANRLGHPDAAKLLQATLDEEGETDKKLTELAEPKLNQAAVA